MRRPSVQCARADAEPAEHAETISTQSTPRTRRFFRKMLGELGDLRVCSVSACSTSLCVLYPSVGTRQGDHLARYRDADALLKHGQRLVLAHDKYRLQQLRRVVHRCK